MKQKEMKLVLVLFIISAPVIRAGFSQMVSTADSREIACLNLLSLSADSKGKEAAALKADLLRARNMKRYINQLTVAKKQCEKRIRLLGGPNYEQQEDGAQDEGDGPQSQRVQIQITQN